MTIESNWFTPRLANVGAKLPDSGGSPPTSPANAVLRVNAAGDGYEAGPGLMNSTGDVSLVNKLTIREYAGAPNGQQAINIRNPVTLSPAASAIRWDVENIGQRSLIYGEESPETPGANQLKLLVGNAGDKYLAITNYGAGQVIRAWFSESLAIWGSALRTAGAQTIITQFASSDQVNAAPAGNSGGGQSIFRGGNYIVGAGAFANTSGRAELRSGHIQGAGDPGATHTAGPVWVYSGRATAAAGTNVQGNVAIGGTTSAIAFDYQGMQDGIHIQDATAIPTGDPASGAFMYVNPATDLIEWRQPAASLPVLNGASGGNALAEQIRDALVAYGLATV